MRSYILIKTAGGKAKGILEEIREIEGVDEAHALYGPYDIIVKTSMDDVAAFVIDRLRMLEGVSDTTTLIVAM